MRAATETEATTVAVSLGYRVRPLVKRTRGTVHVYSLASGWVAVCEGRVIVQAGTHAEVAERAKSLGYTVSPLVKRETPPLRRRESQPRSPNSADTRGVIRAEPVEAGRKRVLETRKTGRGLVDQYSCGLDLSDDPGLLLGRRVLELLL